MRRARGAGRETEKTRVKKKGGVREKIGGLSEFLTKWFEKGAAEWQIVKALGGSKKFGGLTDAEQKARIRKHAWRLKEKGKDVRYNVDKKFYKIY